MTSNELEIFKQSILDDVRVMMQTTGQVTQYIGARYVPLFAEPLDWSAEREYEPLTIVLDHGNSFTSRQFVPRGVDISDESFWANTGNYNAQIEQYRQEVNRLSRLINHSAISFDTLSDALASTDIEVGMCVLTAYHSHSGDCGGAAYEAVAKSKADGVLIYEGTKCNLKLIEKSTYNCSVFGIFPNKDISSRLQEVIDYFADNNLKLVFNEGEYTLNSSVYLSSNTTITGTRSNRTFKPSNTIFVYSGSDFAFKCNGTVTESGARIPTVNTYHGYDVDSKIITPTLNINLSHFNVKCDNGGGLLLLCALSNVIEDVSVRGLYGLCSKISWYNTIENCAFRSTSYSILMENDNDQTTINNVTAFTSAKSPFINVFKGKLTHKSAVYLNYLYAVSFNVLDAFVDNRAEDVELVYANFSNGLTFTSPMMEGYFKTAFYLESNNFITITSPWVYYSGDNAARIINSNGTNIIKMDSPKSNCPILDSDFVQTAAGALDVVTNNPTGAGIVPFAIHVDTDKVYVDSANGKANNNGIRSDSPVQTIEQAMNIVNMLKAENVTVNLAAGSYDIKNVNVFKNVTFNGTDDVTFNFPDFGNGVTSMRGMTGNNNQVIFKNIKIATNASKFEKPFNSVIKDAAYVVFEKCNFTLPDNMALIGMNKNSFGNVMFISSTIQTTDGYLCSTPYSAKIVKTITSNSTVNITNNGANVELI